MNGNLRDIVSLIMYMDRGLSESWPSTHYCWPEKVVNRYQMSYVYVLCFSCPLSIAIPAVADHLFFFVSAWCFHHPFHLTFPCSATSLKFAVIVTHIWWIHSMLLLSCCNCEKKFTSLLTIASVFFRTSHVSWVTRRSRITSERVSAYLLPGLQLRKNSLRAVISLRV